MTLTTPSQPRSTRRRSAVVAGIVAFASLLGIAAAAPVHAADAYRYWIYWDAGATPPWIFATKGPDSLVPKDGTADGWRFAIAGEPQNTVRSPRIQPNFEAVCGSTPVPPAGQKRVAVVIDFGTTADAPAGSTPPAPDVQCVVAPEKATSTQVLAATGRIRAEGGFICAIDGYPATGCGDVIPNATIPPLTEPTLPVPVAASDSASSSDSAQTSSSPSPTATTAAESGSTTPWLPIVGVIVIAALAIGGFAISRRNRE